MMSLESELLRVVKQVVQREEEEAFTLLHEPFIPAVAWQYVKECLDTGWVSSAGAYVTRFEAELATATECSRAVTTVNGTTALEVCLYLAGVKAGDEVICPALTFVATPNAVSRAGAVPHFVDVDETRLSICPDALEACLREMVIPTGAGATNRRTGRRIGAVCVMHCFGHPADLDPILEICRRYEIPLIEDAAESLGSTYKGMHTGHHGLLSAVSFNGNKILTTGGGGAILTNDTELADRAKHLTTTAKVPHAWEFFHDELGWNYRLPNINAALGVAQLECLPRLLAAKRTLANCYEEAIVGVNGVSFLKEPKDSCSNYWLNCLLLDRSDQTQRDRILKKLNDNGFQSRPIWEPMHNLPMYQACPRQSLDRTESICRRAFNIPSSAQLAADWCS